MDNQDIRALKILEETDNGQLPSQRYLADRLNVSLGLVNSFLKRLVNKGYFKITSIPANRVKYILTPKGAAEKSRLTYEYIQYSFKFYKESRLRLQKIFSRLSNESVRKIVFYSVSDLTEVAYLSMLESDISLAAIVDATREGETIIGREIIGLDKLVNYGYDRVLLTGIGNEDRSIGQLVEHGVAVDDIVLIVDRKIGHLEN